MLEHGLYCLMGVLSLKLYTRLVVCLAVDGAIPLSLNLPRLNLPHLNLSSSGLRWDKELEIWCLSEHENQYARSKSKWNTTLQPQECFFFFFFFC
jgi:hypothetical protein